MPLRNALRGADACQSLWCEVLELAITDARHCPRTRRELTQPSQSIACILGLLDIDRGWWGSKAVPELERRWALADAERAAVAKVEQRREQKRLWQKAYDDAHRDEIRARRRARYAADPELPRAMRRAYFAERRTEILAAQRGRRAAKKTAAAATAAPAASSEGRLVTGDPAPAAERRSTGRKTGLAAISRAPAEGAPV